MEGEFIDKFKVMGIHIGRRRECISKYVSRGSNFILTREPQNEYDENAILINLPVRNNQYAIDLGYMPRELSAEIAPLIDSGIEFKTTFRTKITNEKTGKLIHLYLNLIRMN